jgi:hypothetical protein
MNSELRDEIDKVGMYMYRYTARLSEVLKQTAGTDRMVLEDREIAFMAKLAKVLRKQFYML